jgi:diguanylate cyclase (GGDEF)-like protein
VRSFLTTWEGRTLKLTIAFNLDEYLESLAKDHVLVYQEMRANEAISRGMREADPERGIETTISCIAENMQPERFLTFEERNDNTVSATYEWTAPGVIPLKEELQSILRAELRGLYAKFVSERLVMVRDMEEFRKEYPGFSFRIHGVRSFVSGQLLLQNQREGFTLVVNPSAESFDTGSVLYTTLTDFIAVMIRNRNSLRELERQSMIDQLTGAGNRRALERRIREWQGDGVLGVISIDLNGLKNTNDTKGHHAGDMLISETARVLGECAGEGCVFRTGGDEFVVITEDLEERDILLLIQHMRKSAENNGISMAVGFACTRGEVADFDALLTKADLNMYQDKGHSFRRRRSDR